MNSNLIYANQLTKELRRIHALKTPRGVITNMTRIAEENPELYKIPSFTDILLDHFAFTCGLQNDFTIQDKFWVVLDLVAKRQPVDTLRKQVSAYRERTTSIENSLEEYPN